MKKLVLSVLAAGLMMPVLTASADYYDCNWQVHSGDPAPSECHMFVTPEDRTANTLSPSGSSGRTSDDDNNVHNLTPSGSSGRTSDDNSDTGVHNLSPSGTSGRTSVDNTETDTDVNYLTPSGSASDFRGENDNSDNYPATDENDSYKDYYKKNVRDYCVRDVCYVLYDWCYDEIHCEAKKDVVARDEYDPQYDPYDPNYSRNRNNTWNYWINYYINNYYGMPACDSRYQKCVYRGYHFGGYHNGYWPSQY